MSSPSLLASAASPSPLPSPASPSLPGEGELLPTTVRQLTGQVGELLRLTRQPQYGKSYAGIALHARALEEGRVSIQVFKGSELVATWRSDLEEVSIFNPPGDDSLERMSGKLAEELSFVESAL